MKKVNQRVKNLVTKRKKNVNNKYCDRPVLFFLLISKKELNSTENIITSPV